MPSRPRRIRCAGNGPSAVGRPGRWKQARYHTGRVVRLEVDEDVVDGSKARCGWCDSLALCLGLPEVQVASRYSTRDTTRAAGGSSWQSLRRGTRAIETDYLNGEIVLLGRMHGVPTPANDLMQRLARELVVTQDAPGATPAAEILKRIEGHANQRT